MDLAIYTNNPLVRAGIAQRHYIRVVNIGNLTTNALVRWTHDSIFVYQSSRPSGHYIVGKRQLEWNIQGLAPGASHTLYVISTIPQNTPRGTLFHNTAEVFPKAGDIRPWNNIAHFSDSVIRSYDPNDKLVSPQGQGSDGLIHPDSQRMGYTIRFENVGNLGLGPIITQSRPFV